MVGAFVQTLRCTNTCGSIVRNPTATRTVFRASLACSNVTRGQSTTCSVSFVGVPTGSAAEAKNWEFTAGATKVERGATSSLTWTGTAVVEGTVSAEVYLDGASKGRISAALSVTGRNWATAPVIASKVSNGTFLLLPVPPQPTGGDSGLGYSEAQLGHGEGMAASVISSGPNAGYVFYQSSLQYNVHSYRYQINPDLENPNSAFSTHQCGNYSASSGVGFISHSNLLTHTNRHEWNSATQSHYAFYKSGLATNDPQKYLEGRIGLPGANLTEFNATTGEGLQAAYNQILAAFQVHPFPVNHNEVNQFWGDINYALVPCN